MSPLFPCSVCGVQIERSAAKGALSAKEKGVLLCSTCKDKLEGERPQPLKATTAARQANSASFFACETDSTAARGAPPGSLQESWPASGFFQLGVRPLIPFRALHKLLEGLPPTA